MAELNSSDVADFFRELDPIREQGGDLIPFYDKVALTYDQIRDVCGGQQPAEKLATQLKSLMGNKPIEDVYVIDVGAGTGYMGEALLKMGFKRIDSLDPSKVSQELCKKKNIYCKYFNDYLLATPTNGIPDNSYDAAISNHSFVEGHISIESLKELARMVKPGGIILYTLHDPKYTMNYMEEQGRFMKEGVLELLSMTLEPYKKEYTRNMEYVYGYYVAFKVL